MTDYVADTHALIWYLTDSDQLGPAASAAFDACDAGEAAIYAVSYTHLRAHETVLDLVCRLLLEKKKKHY